MDKLGASRKLKVDQVSLPASGHRHGEDPVGVDDLSRSIAEVGLLSPIVVRRVNGDQYEVVCGSRRMLAIRRLGWDRVKAFVVERGELETEIVRWHENLKRTDLNAIEEGEALLFMREKFGLSETDISVKLGRSLGWVSQRLSMVEGPQDVRDAVASGTVGFSVGRELMLVADPAKRRELLSYASRGGVSAELARDWKNQANIEEEKGIGVVTAPPGESAVPVAPIERPGCEVCGGLGGDRPYVFLRVCADCGPPIRAEWVRMRQEAETGIPIGDELK